MTRTILLFALLFAPACNDGASGSGAAGNPPIRSSARTTSVGWLGAHVQPLASALDVTVDGHTHAPGGLVVVALDEGAALAQAGARAGDVLVRVGEDWVPLREDPTLDFMELVEQSVSGGEERVALAAWRGGGLVELELALDRPALEVGLPVEVERFRSGAAAALERLLAWQRPDGGWPAPEGVTELACDALAGMALMSSDGAGEPVAAALERTAARIEALAGDASTADPIGRALAVGFLAERIGPLPPEVLLAAAPRVVHVAGVMGAPGGAPPPGAVMVLGGGAPGEIELPADGEGGMQVVTMSGGGELPEGFELPEGAQLSFGTVSGGSPPEAAGALPVLPAGERPDLSVLLAEHDPERGAQLERLSAVVDGLLALQADDGAWGAADGEDAARIFPTACALSALGAAQRVGLELEAEPVERGCARLRALVHEGKVAAAVARGADRRDEAGRAAAAAFAFLALGCPETDPFVQATSRYADEAGRYLLECSADLRWQLFFTALSRRHLGLASWARFYDEFRLALVAWQRPDGAFEIPSGRDDPGEPASAPAFDTALGALLLELQAARVPVTLGLAENPLAPTIDGEGKRADAATPALEAEEVEGTVDPEQLREILESMGIDPDSADVQISVGGGPPEEDG